jgi:sulfide dehydrogenase cytochrome subunit
VRCALTAALLAWSSGAAAADATTVTPRPGTDAALLASVCAGCHRPDAGDTGGIPSLWGLTADEIADKLTAYRSGELQGTLMNRLARGYTEAEIRMLADALGVAAE